ncbi:hypothetical protein SADUNF_Sadunf06G0070700 [Salix dunnii]|uniref:Uncharacterized protein n=1 Tax=Salix dunnii TaxID=1413687 RepID=A0A835K5Y6_9ROSI|nr:hypothetical protein SADUNF_Sadunf06G0070700 [Salix dunnii]
MICEKFSVPSLYHAPLAPQRLVLQASMCVLFPSLCKGGSTISIVTSKKDMELAEIELSQTESLVMVLFLTVYSQKSF